MGLIWQRVSAPLFRCSSYGVSLSRSISTGYLLNMRKSSQGREYIGLLQNFLRLKDGNTADLVGELQTSIVSYRKKIPWLFYDPFLKVDLVSEVHFSHKRYFKILRSRLENYDCILYEGIQKKEDLSIRDTKKAHAFQAALFCLEPLFMSRNNHMPYERLNWINADLDLQTYLRLEEATKRRAHKLKRNISNTRIQPQSNDMEDTKIDYNSIDLPMLIRECMINKESRVLFRQSLESLYELGLQNYWKLLIARLFVDIKKMTPIELAEYSIEVVERNKVAIEELKNAINRGEKSIAILYGAAHMPDFHARLYKELGLVPTNVDWITVWSIKRIKFKIIRLVLEKCLGKDIAMTMILASYSFYFSVANHWLRLKKLRLS